MEPQPVSYIPGTQGESALPLARYLPPLLPGMVAGWLQQHVEPSGWVIDPLNASPAVALEAARAGYRVIVVSSNPVLTFMLEVLASAPRPAEFQAVLAELGASRRGEERLELHLQALYRTQCAACGGMTQAQGYLWKRGETAPYARLYRCSQCRAEEERALDPGDIQRLSLPGNTSLHRARALSRVAGPEDEHYPAVQEALGAYLDRPLYVLSTLINKQEGLPASTAQRRLLQALLISACDSASALWPHGSGPRVRPRQLTQPVQFRENNIWLAMEEAIPAWCGLPEAVPLVHWPELPPAGGISLFAGRARGLLPLPETVKPAALLAVFPRPHQAFWTLSTLWAGWLWGRESAMPLHALLGRRRFDWAWHANAMHQPLAALVKALPPATPLIGLLPELAPGFLASVLAAAGASGFRLQGLALREDEELAQALWRAAAPSDAPTSSWSEWIEEGLREVLEQRAEPAPYLPLYAAGLVKLAQEGGLETTSGPAVPASGGDQAGDLLVRVQGLTGRAFANHRLVRRFDGGSQDDERGLWWLVDPPADLAEPLADRAEREVVRLLQHNPGIPDIELEAALCRAFPGLLTPPTELVQAILESYAEQVPGQVGRRRLLPQEIPAKRRGDLEETRRLLQEMGERIGFTFTGDAAGGAPLVWTPRSFGQVYYFYPMASSLVSRYLLGAPPAPVRQCVMVFPGSRARLLSFKLRRDPRLAELLKGWHLLKFRHLRSLSERRDLTAEIWEGLLDADPPFFEEAEQMRLL
jgi:hypothetical protein